MLLNPFTPSEIACQPQDFFGRKSEVDTLERSLSKGSVAIQGAIGVGKSSLLARVRLKMEGFNSSHQCHTVLAVGNKDILTVDDAARLLLDRFLQCDETNAKVKISLAKVFEFESGKICRFFKEGRHLEVLNNLIEEHRFPNSELLVLAIDEADKCPVPLARLMRSLSTHVQHSGTKNIRFALAGVSPFFKFMVDEDPGVNRFVYKVLSLPPLPRDEALDMIESKLKEVARDSVAQNLALTIQPQVIERIVRLSGGHPHLLQLLGSHLIEHENEDPDGVLDERDLANSLRTICYEDRTWVYDSTLHMLETEGKLESFRQLLFIASTKCPTRIDRDMAQRELEPETLDWFVTRNILTLHSSNDYGLVDEFLRIRLIWDDLAKEEVQEGPRRVRENELERLLLGQGRFSSDEEGWEDDQDGELGS